MKSALLIPILVSLGACAVVRVPPHEAPSRFGVVHADDPDTAREHARLLDDVGPFVASALAGLRIEPVDLRIVAGVSNRLYDLPHPKPSGACVDSGSVKWVEMRADLEPASRGGVLAHELVHRWLGPEWRTLSPALEDGLANVMGDAIRQNETPRERMLCFLTSWITLNGELTVDRNAVPVGERDVRFSVTYKGRVEKLTPALILDVMGSDLDDYHALGASRFTVVTILSRRLLSRISVDRLFELCRDAAEEGLARLPPERVFAEAGMDPHDLTDWNELLLESYGLEERLALRQEGDVPWNIAVTSETHGAGMAFRLQATVDF